MVFYYWKKVIFYCSIIMNKLIYYFFQLTPKNRKKNYLTIKNFQPYKILTLLTLLEKQFDHLLKQILEKYRKKVTVIKKKIDS